ncbi:spherulation-specific family 4 protein [Streptomyces sp. NPDC046557]|uniref:spherulation-specific family 4 protein n=1 Tax=Streptomyces sp. NPDC046557 TaxID=3155372 RepID=UPI003409FB71
MLASVDNYLKTPDGRLHVDGIFFDVVSRDCGPANATRDLYERLRRYVADTVHAVDPALPDLVVNNPGTAVADCYPARLPAPTSAPPPSSARPGGDGPAPPPRRTGRRWCRTRGTRG